MDASRLLLPLLLVTAGLLWVSASMAQPATGSTRSLSDTLTADQAVERALRENPTLQAAQAGASAAAASVREARSAWFPVIRGEASYRRLSDNVDYTVDLPGVPGGGDQPVTFAPAILNRYAARASIEQPVFTGFRIPSQLDAAQARTRAAEARAEARRDDIRYRTRAAYWQLYEAQARERAAVQALRQIERRLTDVRNQRAAGRATEADVLRVQARRDRVRVERIQARDAVQSARRALNDQMGRPLDAPIVLADTVRTDSTARDVSQLVEEARGQRPDLEALRQTIRAREAAVDVAQADWYPQVALTGSYLYARPNEQLFPPEEQFQGTWQAGVTLSWRLPLGGGTDAAADRAAAQRQEARYELQDRRRDVDVEVRNQVQSVVQARQAVAAAETSLQSAEAAYRAVQSRFEAGMLVVSDLLDAERALREARAGLAQAQAQYATARAALARALSREPNQDSP